MNLTKEEVESLRIEEAGRFADFDYMVLVPGMGHRCGYVRIPKGHPLYGVDYYDEAPWFRAIDLWDREVDPESPRHPVIPFFLAALARWTLADKVKLCLLIQVHGGLTYSGDLRNDGGFWIGFDCGHAGDGWDLDLMNKENREFYSKHPNPMMRRGEVRSLPYVRSEIKSMIGQIIDLYGLSFWTRVKLVFKRVWKLARCYFHPN